MFCMLYAFFWVIPRHLMVEQTECSKTSTYKIQTPGNYPEESIQHSEHSESLKSRILHFYEEETAKICRWNSVPKRQHITFRHQGITQKKAYNREYYFHFAPQQPMKFEGLIENVEEEGLRVSHYFQRLAKDASKICDFIFCLP